MSLANCVSSLTHNEKAYVTLGGGCFVHHHIGSYKNSHSAIGRKMVFSLMTFSLTVIGLGWFSLMF